MSAAIMGEVERTDKQTTPGRRPACSEIWHATALATTERICVYTGK